MMIVRILLLALLTACAGPMASAFDAVGQVRLARERVGAKTWSREVLLELREATDVFPREVAALVFEYQGILWLYTPYDGTRSLALLLAGARPERVNLAGIIRPQISTVLAVRTLADEGRPEPGGHLRQGCFIDSLAALRREISTGAGIRRAALLCYYTLGDGMKGAHTVAFVETATERFVIDASRSATPIEVAEGRTRSAQSLAAAVAPWGEVTSARWLPVIEDGERVPAAVGVAACAGR